MNKVLLTVSGLIDPNLEDQIARGERPEPDYVRMASVFPADLIDYAAARRLGGRVGRLFEKIGGPNLLLAWTCYRLRGSYQVIFTDGEQVGIPLSFFLKFATLGKRPAHLMIGHFLSVKKKMIFFDWLRLFSHIDICFVYSTWQKHFIENRWKIPPERVVFTPFTVDASFFAPIRSLPDNPLGIEWSGKPLICAVGLEFRDYPTFIESVRDLDIQVIIAAASPWSKRADTTRGQEIPDNVLVRRFSQYDLRTLYAMSSFVVMPLYEVNFQAGVTAILEAMAMGKAVICSRTSGQTDIVIEDNTGIYVPPGNPNALKEAVLYLMNNPAKAEQMGESGRQYVIHNLSSECYASRLKRYLQDFDYA